jgi:hypothetical protein
MAASELVRDEPEDDPPAEAARSEQSIHAVGSCPESDVQVAESATPVTGKPWAV